MADNNNIWIRLRTSASGVSTTLRGIRNETKGVGSSFAVAYNHTRKMNTAFTNLSKDANRASSSLRGISIALKGISYYAVGNGIAKMTQSAIDMVETANLFSVAMGKNAESTQQFVQSMSNVTGLDVTNMQNAVGTFGLLGRSMGMSAEQSQVLAENTYKLGIDLASLNNVSLNQALGDLRSGLVGQSETMYKYGVDVTEASLKQEALNQGIKKSVRNMSQGEKMALRYAVMIRQTSLAHGDFAKTINSPANQLKILAERFVTLGRVAGNLFLKLVAPVLPYLNAVVLALTDILRAVSALFGVELPEIINTDYGFSGVEDGADDATEAIAGTGKELKKLKNYTMGFDELNVISPPTSVAGASGGANASGGKSILEDMDLSGYENKLKELKDISQDLANEIRPKLEAILSIGLLIGGMFLGWKIAGGIITGLTMIKDLCLLISGATIVSPFMKLFAQMKMFGGVLAIASGLYLAFKGIKEILEQSNPSWESYAKAMGGVALVAGGLALVFSSTLVGGIALVVGAVAVAVLAIVKNWDEIKTWFFNMLYAIKNRWNEFSGQFITDMTNGIEEAKNVWKTFTTNVYGLFNLAKTNISTGWNNLLTGISTLLTTIGTGISTAWNALWSSIAVFASTIWNNIQLAWSTFIQTITNVFNTAKSTLKNAWDGLWNGLGGAVKVMANGVFGFVEGMLNGIVNAINGVINKIQALISSANSALSKLGMKTISINIRSIDQIRIPRLARGGILENGQLFQAGEFGKAELTGSYNGKTAVMPLENSGFVDAMYEAVFNAVTQAQSNGGQVIENVLNLDGEVVYKNQQKISSGRGVNFGMGVFAR